MKKILLITSISIFTILVAISGYGFYIYKSVETTVEGMHITLDREKSEKRFEQVYIVERDPLSFLLMGVDARGTERGRTDTLMVITVNPNDESMKLVSIPRDTYTKIVGRGFQDKINHAYAFGGPEMAINTVENFLDIPIDYFITVNMAGFKDIVDALGGVTVNSKMAFRSGGHNFEEGQIFLDGSAALAYSRMRYQDPRGDLGRNERQRQIIQSIIAEGADISNITRFTSILDSIGKNLSTDLAFNDMVKISQNYHSARHNSETLEISGSGGRQGGIWYLFVPEEERLRISTTLRTHLGLEEDSRSLTQN